MKRTLKQKVEYCLERFPETRDSDGILTAKIWEIYNQEQIDLFKKYYDEGKYTLSQILAGFIVKVPQQPSVKRVRAHIQNVEKRFPAQAISVQAKRKLSNKDQTTWHDTMEEYGLTDTGEDITL